MTRRETLRRRIPWIGTVALVLSAGSGVAETRRPPLSMAGETRLASGAAREAGTGSPDLSEDAVREEVIRRLEARIQRRREATEARGPEPVRAPAIPASEVDPGLEERLRSMLGRGAGRDPAAFALPSAEHLPDDRAAFVESARTDRTLLDRVPAGPGAFPERNPAAPTGLPDHREGEPRGFVSPELVGAGEGWSLPEDLSGREQGLFPPEVLGRSSAVVTPDSRGAVRPPPPGLAPASLPPRPERPDRVTVQAGDTLWSLARRFGLSVAELARTNSLDPSLPLSLGRELRIPGGTPERDPDLVAARSPGATSVPLPASPPLPVPSARNHTVKAGDTLYKIARAHGVTVDELIRANPELSASHLSPGRVLQIPEALGTVARPPPATPGWTGPARNPAAPPSATRTPASPGVASGAGGTLGPAGPLPGHGRDPGGAAEAPAAVGTGTQGPRLAWPIEGNVTAAFGWKEGRPHTGIDISAPAGTVVRAAASGKVIYAGQMRTYGNVVILDHLNGYFTVYGHNQENLVRRHGDSRLDRIEAGAEIAKVGTTGDAVGPQLHFEVRKLNQAVDPFRYLAPRGAVRAGVPGR